MKGSNYRISGVIRMDDGAGYALIRITGPQTKITAALMFEAEAEADNCRRNRTCIRSDAMKSIAKKQLPAGAAAHKRS